jgi:hypothetical protein
MIIAKNMIEFCSNFEKILINNKLRKKLIISAKKKYVKYFAPEIVLKENLILIKNYSK